jgi:hypothetical protein
MSSNIYDIDPYTFKEGDLPSMGYNRIKKLMGELDLIYYESVGISPDLLKSSLNEYFILYTRTTPNKDKKINDIIAEAIIDLGGENRFYIQTLKGAEKYSPSHKTTKITKEKLQDILKDFPQRMQNYGF